MGLGFRKLPKSSRKSPSTVVDDADDGCDVVLFVAHFVKC